MSRLTGRTAKGIANLAISKTLPERDQEIEGCNIVLDAIGDVFQKLAEYEDLEEQGRLIKLPCKVGEEVWNIENIWDEETPISMEFDYWMIPFWEETYFLTCEEAVAKLKELRESEQKC